MANPTDIGRGPSLPTIDVTHPPELPELTGARGVKEEAKSLAREAKHQARKVAVQARDQVEGLAERGKAAAAERLDGVAEALREAGRKLEEKEGKAPLRSYADRAAGQVDRVSGYLRDHDLRGVVRDTRELTRRRPVLVLGSTFLAGLLLARWMIGSRSGASKPEGA